MGVEKDNQVLHGKLHKVDMPKSNIAIVWTPLLEWYMVRRESKNIHFVFIIS